MSEFDIKEHLDLYEVLDFLTICSSDKLGFEHFSPTRLSNVLSSGPHHVLVLDTRVFSGADLRMLEMALRVVKVADRGMLLVCLMEKISKKFQKYLNKNSPKTGYRLHSKFKWEDKSPG